MFSLLLLLLLPLATLEEQAEEEVVEVEEEEEEEFVKEIFCVTSSEDTVVLERVLEENFLSNLMLLMLVLFLVLLFFLLDLPRRFFRDSILSNCSLSFKDSRSLAFQSGSASIDIVLARKRVGGVLIVGQVITLVAVEGLVKNYKIMTVFRFLAPSNNFSSPIANHLFESGLRSP